MICFLMSEFPILPDFARKAGHLISGLFLVYFWLQSRLRPCAYNQVVVAIFIDMVKLR